MKLKTLVGIALLALTAVAHAQSDALGGAGLFTDGSPTGWTYYVHKFTGYTQAYTGNVSMGYDDDDNYVLQFWSNNVATENWHLQASHAITLTKGYSYQIVGGGYMYDYTSGSVYMGVLDTSNSDVTYFADAISLDGAFEGYVYEHCSANVSGKFFISGGDIIGRQSTETGTGGGFAIMEVKVIKTPISCGGSVTPSPSSSSSVKPSSSSSPQPTGERVGPVAQYGQLQAGTNANGKGQIYGSCPAYSVSGKEVQVKGMSLYWSINEASASFWNKTVVDGLVQKHNIQLIRAAMGVDENWGAGNYFTKTAYYQEIMDNVVQAAIDNNIYVIIDYHSHKANDNITNAKSFFTRMAQKWGKYDNVIFEIFNEPACKANGSGDCSTDSFGGGFMTWSTIKSYANTIISTIRQYSDNLIIVGTPTWDQQPNTAIGNEVSDPANNTAYAFHYYAGTHKTTIEGANAVEAMNAGLSVFVSEWGTINADGKGAVASANSTWQKWMNTHKLSSANWSLSNIVEDADLEYGGDGMGGSYFAANFIPTESNTWKYSESGAWLNSNYLYGLPDTYTACAGAANPDVPTVSSSSSKPAASSSSSKPAVSSSSSKPVASSSSSKPAVSSSSSKPAASSSSSKPAVSSSSSKPVASSSSSKPAVSSSSEKTIVWKSTNAVLEENSMELLVIGAAKGEGKRKASLDLELDKGEAYVLTFKAKSISSEQVLVFKVKDDKDETLCSDAADLSEDYKKFSCSFTATTKSASISVSTSINKGEVSVADLSVKEGTEAIKTKPNSIKNYVVVSDGRMLSVSATQNEVFKLEIFDVVGNAVLRKDYVGNASVSLNEIVGGNYILRISGRNGSLINKLIIK